MCGICGIHGFSDEKLIKKMCDALSHRGPDDEGFHIDTDINLGHRRLSIIDVAGGHQPVYNENNTICVVYNGEIYNYQSLREELLKKGHTFTTNTDTEVLVHLYEEYGTELLSLLDGMFAFALWDAEKNTLLLARDRLGIKPLYYTIIEDTLLFASEIKSLLQYEEIKPRIDTVSIDHFLTCRYIPAPSTPLKNIKKLLPGHYLLCKNSQITIKKYWDITLTEDSIVTEEQCIEKLYTLLAESVEKRLMSDVPLGAFLSGGIDSSAIVGIMSRLMDESVKTFSVGFEETSYNELEFAKTISEHFDTEHYELVMYPEKIIKQLPEIIWHLDEPIVDPAAIPTYMVSTLARKHVKVVLNGEGADELFAGYADYAKAVKNQKLQQVTPQVLRHTIATLSRGLPSERLKNYTTTLFNDKQDHILWQPLFTEREKKKLITKHMDSKSPTKAYFSRATGDVLKKMLYTDLKTWIPDNSLHKVDTMTMANSLEGRVPFLDHHLVEYAMTMPSDLKIKNGSEKYVLRASMKKLLPEKILWRRKHGFSVPVHTWIAQELKETIHDALTSRESVSRLHLNTQTIEELLEKPLNRRAGFQIWSLFILELWNKIYIEKENITF